MLSSDSMSACLMKVLGTAPLLMISQTTGRSQLAIIHSNVKILRGEIPSLIQGVAFQIRVIMLSRNASP